ncbi:MAG: hypothetical protein PHP30_03220 [Bacteroidales bacterium]|nr:hypothetical protein [Bacteroidales bacterium]MDD2424937.1 hypothetical protein [Bacteroidales bacterium]MDD3989089.1 hypothetical protein [Bacteroidales bacterium]
MLNLSIIEESGKYTSAEVESVTIPSVKGRFTVFPNHAPIMCVVVPGEVQYVKKGGDSKERYSVRGGVARIENNNIMLCLEQ